MYNGPNVDPCGTQNFHGFDTTVQNARLLIKRVFETKWSEIIDYSL